ncbi:hypothetical protein ADUPG1_003648, partial [Aduncisulcus paluster]
MCVCLGVGTVIYLLSDLFDLLSGEDAAHFFPDSARGIPDIHDSTTV